MYSISEFAGLLVKQAREEKQWDQQYLADELDIDIRTLKKIEAGKSDIPFDTLSSLIHLLEISPKILFYAEHTETGVEMDTLWIIVNDQDLFSCRSESRSKIYRCSCFTNATFLIGDRNYMLTHAEPS